MLVLKRRDGQWVEITHRSGDVIRVRAYRVRLEPKPCVDLAFDDDGHNFEIQREERRPAPAPTPRPAEGA